MGSAYHEMIQSSTFTFLLGPEEEKITVHSGPLKQISKPLAKMMDANMLEAKQGLAKIEDIDKETFLRFCEYAFMKDYTPVEPDILVNPKGPDRENQETNAIIVASAKEISDGCQYNDYQTGLYYNSTRSIHAGPGLRHLCNMFGQREYRSCRAKMPLYRNQTSKTSYASVLKLHASLYTMGDRYDVRDLKELALRKMHELLFQVRPTTLFICDFMTLADYAFSNEHTRDTEPDEPMDPLRDLLVGYMSCMLPRLVDNESFHALLVGQHVVMMKLLKQVSQSLAC